MRKLVILLVTLLLMGCVGNKSGETINAPGFSGIGDLSIGLTREEANGKEFSRVKDAIKKYCEITQTGRDIRGEISREKEERDSRREEDLRNIW